MQQSDSFGETIEDNMIFPSLARNDKFDRKRAKQLIKMSVGTSSIKFGKWKICRVVSGKELL